MESAELERTTADITAKVASRLLELRATGTVVKFDGFLALYQEGQDDDADDEEARRLPPMSAGESLAKRAIAATQHFTEPPPRYSEASLVKRLEELGIGRPSTYASILQVLKDRKYVRLDKRRLYPEDRGRIVVAFLESFFAKYVEYDFTAGPRGAARSHLQQRGGVARGAARFLARLHRRGRRDQGSENLQRD
jgi:DNA topoisomerase-1